MKSVREQYDELRYVKEDPSGYHSLIHAKARRLLTLDIIRKYYTGGGRVLDLGSGEGDVAFELSKKAAMTLGIEGSMKALERARKLQHDGLQFIYGDLEGVAVLNEIGKEQWDLIVVIEVLLCLTRSASDGIMAAIAESLSPAGVAVISTCYEPEWSRDRLLGNMFTKDELRRYLNRWFAILHMAPISAHKSPYEAAYGSYGVILRSLLGSGLQKEKLALSVRSLCHRLFITIDYRLRSTGSVELYKTYVKLAGRLPAALCGEPWMNCAVVKRK